MKLKLVTDNDRVHALVTEQGDVVTGVVGLQLQYGREAAPHGKRAIVELVDLDIEIVPSEDVPFAAGRHRRST